MIAHRLSTVRRADEILVVEHGRIVQRGRASELLARDGPFRRLARELAAPPTRCTDCRGIPFRSPASRRRAALLFLAELYDSPHRRCLAPDTA